MAKIQICRRNFVGLLKEGEKVKGRNIHIQLKKKVIRLVNQEERLLSQEGLL